MSLVSLLLYLVVAVICARLATKVVSHNLPGGHTTSVLTGIIGAYLGTSYIAAYGPSFEGVSLFSAIAGSLGLILAVSYLGHFLHKSS